MRGHIVRGLDDPDPKKLLFRAHFLTRRSSPDSHVLSRRWTPAGGGLRRIPGGGLTLACAALEPRIKRAAFLFRSSATISACGRWIWQRTRTRSSDCTSGSSIPA